ncbi:MAG: hypothetical protein K2J11_11125 [Oscillospiraceae bacterium]|nr:hypothetical protein [Oscillospiraceae bacterium]
MLRTATRRGGRVRPSSERFRVPHLLLRFERYAPAGARGDFAVCGRRPKAPPLDFASWAQLDQLHFGTFRFAALLCFSCV